MPKILLIDDSSFQRRLIKRLVESLGHETVMAGNGAEGLALATGEQSFDAAIVDLLMPEMDGFTFLERVREAGCAFPRIVVTADVQEQSAARCRELGAAAVLSKPLQEQTLRETLEAHLHAEAVTK